MRAAEPFCSRCLELNFPGPREPMRAIASPTPWGLESVWGQLTDELRQQLGACGCDRAAFVAALRAAWCAGAERSDRGPVRLCLEVIAARLLLVHEGGPVAHVLARGELHFVYTWAGAETRLLMRRPSAGQVLDFWELLPQDARHEIEREGTASADVNARLSLEAAAVTLAGCDGLPEVRLVLQRLGRHRARLQVLDGGRASEARA